MNLVTVGKNGRVYVRKFDHEEARRRVAAGESVYKLHREFGVSYSAVFRVLTPENKAVFAARQRAHYAARCEVCGGECLSARHPSKLAHSPDGRDLCRRCRSDEKIERLRFDSVTNEVVAVRCNMLDCANGERWQPPANFARGVQFKEFREGGIHGICRACNTFQRRDYRRRNPEKQAAYDRAYKARRRAKAAHG